MHNPLRESLNEKILESFKGQKVVEMNETTVTLTDVLWKILRQESCIAVLSSQMRSEREALELLLSKIQSATTF